jgi:4-hydroxybenzoate polyprenyltransferase
MNLPRSGVELGERIAERWRWFAFRVRFHPWTTNELPRILATISDYAQLTRLDKPAGCAINDYADRSFDPRVERTRKRPLAAGRITTVEALLLFAALSLTALALVLQLNKMTLLFALAGAALAVTYPFIKRFLSVPQMYLGVTFGWGIPMAFAAQVERVPRVAWLLLIANVLWVTVYDTMYAMVDRNDDVNIGVRSTAILFGDSDRHIIAALQALTLFSLYLVGGMMRMSAWYYGGLVAGGLFFIHHLWLIRARERAGCFKAFLNNHYFGMSVFLGIALNYQFG